MLLRWSDVKRLWRRLLLLAKSYGGLKQDSKQYVRLGLRRTNTAKVDVIVASTMIMSHVPSVADSPCYRSSYS
jgi:hypothetical protein